MPITLLKEVTRSWILGSIICDAFVTIDLLCCTASILHLVAIALDRYWSITNRKSRIKLLFMIKLTKI
jgi:5-hydroxytryptamine receptor 1